MVSLAGMTPTFSQFDTPCIFARNLDIINDVLAIWTSKMGPVFSQPDGPVEIMYPLDYLPTSVPAQMALINSCVDDMATSLGASIVEVSIRTLWESSPPIGAVPDIEEFLHDVIVHTYYYSFYHATDNFRHEFCRAFGHKPYVIPFVERRWASGAGVSQEQYAEGLNRLDTYRNWLLEKLFRHSKVLMVLPISAVEPHYRDEPAESPGYQTATDELFLSPILRAPDVVVPIGELPYHSRIRNKQEYLPVALNVVGAPTTDGWVLESMRRVLGKSGRPMQVSTGSRICC